MSGFTSVGCLHGANGCLFNSLDDYDPIIGLNARWLTGDAAGIRVRMDGWKIGRISIRWIKCLGPIVVIVIDVRYADGTGLGNVNDSHLPGDACGVGAIGGRFKCAPWAAAVLAEFLRRQPSRVIEFGGRPF